MIALLLLLAAPHNYRTQLIQTLPYYAAPQQHYLYEWSDTQTQPPSAPPAPHYAYNQPSGYPNYPPAIPTFTTTTTSTAAPTTPTTTTTEFFLPEIIINRKAPVSKRPHLSYLPIATSKTTTTLKAKPNYQQSAVNAADEDNSFYDYEAPSSPLPFTTIRSTLPSLHLVLNQLRCLAPHPTDGQDTNNKIGFFQALLSIQSTHRIENTPVAEAAFINVAEDVVDSTGDNGSLSSYCGIRLINATQIVVDVPVARFAACGIEPCSTIPTNEQQQQQQQHQQLCMRLRFPQIASMRTAADAVLTLQCRVQERIAAQTHALRLPTVQQKSDNVSGRSSSTAQSAAQQGTIAHGGSQLPYNTHVSLGRMLTTTTTAGRSVPRTFETLPAGATVRLGEELLLRAQVQPGDGWRHTRLADVQLQRIGTDGGIVQAINLLDADGCVPTAMRAVCEVPVFEAPLGQRMPFRVVMFDGMRSGDEMLLSVRIVGCLRRTDCAIDSDRCDTVDERLRKTLQSGHRKRRAYNIDGANTGAISRLSFRVELPSEYLVDDAADDVRSRSMRAALTHIGGLIGIIATVAFIVLAVVIGLFVNSRHNNK